MKRVIHFMVMFLLGVTVMAQTDANNTARVDSDSPEVLTYQNESATMATPCPYLDRVGGHYYLGDDPLSSKEYKDFLKNNSPEAWEKYRTGSALWATGWSLFGVGAAAVVVSPIAALTGITLSATESGHGGGLVVGPVLYVGGGLLLAGSIPCIIVGGVKKKRSMDVYNNCCVQKRQQALQLSLQTSQNGIGLALTF